MLNEQLLTANSLMQVVTSTLAEFPYPIKNLYYEVFEGTYGPVLLVEIKVLKEEASMDWFISNVKIPIPGKLTAFTAHKLANEACACLYENLNN